MANFRIFEFDNEKFLVNIDNITQIYSNGDDECKIWFIDQEDFMRVSGTLDDIYFIISGERIS